MRALLPCLMLVCALAVLGCAARGDTPERALKTKQAAPAPSVEASYGYSAETAYRRIVVKGGKLRYTYNGKNSLVKPGERVMRQQPYYTQADLVTKDAALSAAELGALAKQVRTSGFLKLKKVYDDRPRERAYSVAVSGGVDGKRRSVEVRHGTAPRAFKELADSLHKLVRKHFPAAPNP